MIVHRASELRVWAWSSDPQSDKKHQAQTSITIICCVLSIMGAVGCSSPWLSDWSQVKNAGPTRTCNTSSIRVWVLTRRREALLYTFVDSAEKIEESWDHRWLMLAYTEEHDRYHFELRHCWELSEYPEPNYLRQYAAMPHDIERLHGISIVINLYWLWTDQTSISLGFDRAE